MGFTQERELKKKVTLVSAACLLGAGISSYFLYQDFISVGRDGVGAPIAHVDRMEEKVRRKPKGLYVWSNVETRQPLYLKDSIQTGADSAVSITLVDGRTLELSEKSLVVLDTSSELALQFVHGTGVVHGKDGDAHISVDETGKTRIEPLSMKLVSPAPFAELFTSDTSSTDVLLKWEILNQATTPGQTPPGLEISTDRNFKKEKTVAHKLEAGVQEKSIRLEPGKYYWRLTHLGPTPPARSFRVATPKPLTPLWPTKNTALQHWGETASADFSWKPDTENIRTATHEIEIALDPGFREVKLQKPISAEAGTLRIDGLTDGNYFWRISSIYGTRKLASATTPFSVQTKKKAPIILTHFADRASVEMRPELRFTWVDDATANLDYRWEITRSPNGAPEAEAHSRTGFATWKSPQPGHYRWRVTASLGAQIVAESNWRELHVQEGRPIALKTPEKDAKFRFWETPAQFAFEWSDEKNAEQSYVLELSTDADFTNIVKSQASKPARVNSASLALAPGEYHWRVRVVEKDGTTAKTSKPSTFSYDYHPLLPATKLAGPDDAKVFNPLVKKESLTLSWEPVEGAVAYELVIFRRDLRAPASTDAVFQKTVTKETEIEFKDLRKEGNYTWTVRAIDRIKRPGAEAPRKQFEFTYGARLSAPKSLAPEVQ